jgi:hypothetical protein
MTEEERRAVELYCESLFLLVGSQMSLSVSFGGDAT